ncbi:MAG: SMI1/KNR4 family protein [Myxococcales bacterium]|nr:SMI1/KNR4 family protein [Myxococcales bacterium]
MEAVRITNPGKPLSAGEIDALEQRIGATLPADYRQFLLEHNGGQPWPRDFGESAVRRFLCVGADRALDDVEGTRGFYGTRLPNWALPIAKDAFGNLIVLSIVPSQAGVFFWDHEEEQSPEGLVKIAESFAAFIDLLKQPEQ